MSDRAVRRAVARDVEALVALRAQMFASMNTPGHEDVEWQRATGEWFRLRIDDPSVCLAIVEVDQRAVASAMGAVRDAMPSPTVPAGGDILVSNVCTFPDCRGRGHARAAFDYVMQWARASGIGRAELMATQAGRTMYEAAGFEVVSYPAMRATLRP